jgi:hypothetical protein
MILPKVTIVSFSILLTKLSYYELDGNAGISYKRRLRDVVMSDTLDNS